mgnify:CR=1 FL=1
MGMTLRPEQLPAHLERAGQSLEALYTVTGDEPLLVIEAGDLLQCQIRIGLVGRGEMTHQGQASDLAA